MNRKRTVLLVAGAATVAVLAGGTTTASASINTQIQLARDTLANCQLLVAQPRDEAQRLRASVCVTDAEDTLTRLGVSPTPTPTPTVTPTATPTASSGWPTPSTTGVPAGWVPTSTRTTDLVVTTAGAVVENIRLVNADIRIRAANVTIRRVEVQGGVIWVDNGPCTGNLIEDTSVIRAPGQVTRFSDGPVIGPGGYTLRRVKVDGVPEGIRLGEKNRCGPVVVQDSFIRATMPDNCAGDWHGDALQGYQGPALTVRHSTIEMKVNSSCEGTSPFFYPDQGNTRADIDGLLVIGGRWFAFRLGTPATVRNLNVVGATDIRCSRMEVWQAAQVTVDSAYRITSTRPLACTTEGGN